MGYGAIKILGGFEMARKLARMPLAISSLALILLAGAAQAQQAPFPTRPITLIVPFAPGGATDIVARLMATRIGEDLVQTLVIDNRTGGAGNIGTAAAARAAPDGYTLVLATTSQLINQFLSKSPPFNLFTELLPVALISDAPEVIAISSKLDVETLAQFARAAPADAAERATRSSPQCAIACRVSKDGAGGERTAQIPRGMARPGP
jgi:tripartite-type tricarboxylate transporter receptor subunit TctC